MNAFPTAIASLSDVIAEKRENMRGVLALGVVGLMVVYSLLMVWFVYAKGSTDAETLVTGIFTPIIGIVGTVVGFYFGSQDKADAA